jgi:hypothetical protein
MFSFANAEKWAAVGSFMIVQFLGEMGQQIIGGHCCMRFWFLAFQKSNWYSPKNHVGQYHGKCHLLLDAVVVLLSTRVDSGLLWGLLSGRVQLGILGTKVAC